MWRCYLHYYGGSQNNGAQGLLAAIGNLLFQLRIGVVIHNKSVHRPRYMLNKYNYNSKLSIIDCRICTTDFVSVLKVQINMKYRWLQSCTMC